MKFKGKKRFRNKAVIHAVSNIWCRIAPLSPLGIPHVNLEDDVYNEMFIPKGSIIYQNVFAMHRDENIYSDPYSFNPDRYIPKEEGGKGEPFPVGNFGFGRR